MDEDIRDRSFKNLAREPIDNKSYKAEFEIRKYVKERKKIIIRRNWVKLFFFYFKET